MLEIFLDNFHVCPVVEQIQVVWSDTKSSPPGFISKNKNTVLEVHHNNSLSNRFIPILPISTEAVLSIDDDIVVSCEDLDFWVHSWTMNRRTLVGLSPRITTYDSITGLARYKNWQYTWWNGMYNIVLTKAAILHKSYLNEYGKVIPKEFLQFIDNNRNCEDLAMQYVVSVQSQAPPVWTKVIFYDIASGGISSGGSHFDIRSECVQRLEKLSGYKYPWHIGYQKVTKLSTWNSWKLLWSSR
jgi:glucuronyl/N-acetylglucosaminyl transferase EXT2